MWDYPKSAVHQAAIEAMKPRLDIAAAKAIAAQNKARRASDAIQALKEHEAEKIRHARKDGPFTSRTVSSRGGQGSSGS